jgi:hypothetical protein
MPELTTLDRSKIHLFSIENRDNLYNDAFFICPPMFASLLFNEITILDILESNNVVYNSEELFSGMIHYHNISSYINSMSLKDFNIGIQRANGEVVICRNEKY